jgi:hypothetical protein
VKVLKLIFSCALFLALSACSGSRKYFKAAERLEKQGLVEDAADYYLVALQRKPTNVDARIKLKEVGQKYVSSMASEFFRNYNTRQTEASLEVFERMKEFTSRCKALNVQLDYPTAYEEDYKASVDQFLNKNYNQAYLLVNQKKYFEALPYLKKVEKYNPAFKNTQQLEIIATCEPLYQNAVNNLSTKNYGAALSLLSQIKVKTDNYKDSRDLLMLATDQQSRTFILFEPRVATTEGDKQIQNYLYDNFRQTALEFKNPSILNNTPFQTAPQNADLNSAGNIDLVQAIRKATGADYFYVFSISNRRELTPSLTRTPLRAFLEVVKKINDTTTVTEYKPVDYATVKGSRTFSYDFRYTIINAYSNQVMSSQVQQIKVSDAIEYNEFIRPFSNNINSLFPYNPQTTPALGRYSPRNFRNNFTARKDLRSFEDLKNEAYTQNVQIFNNTAAIMK